MMDLLSRSLSSGSLPETAREGEKFLVRSDGNKIARGVVSYTTGIFLRGEADVRERERLDRFEAMVVPHLDAAYSLARWLTRNDADADDVVQEAFLRAFRFFDDLRASDCRPWLLTIVRNTCYTWMRRNRPHELVADGDDAASSVEDGAPSAEARLVREADAARLERAIERLRPEYREVLILREYEGLSYKEIASVTGASLGTVMSRLSRARQRLYESLTRGPGKEVHRELH
jgi:RNA polymerase sigma-70 factor (ECF subfamily)